MTITPGVDIGLFSKRTVLTGAGWTRNWGGQLAAEIWQHLMSSRAIQGRASVRQLLLEEPSFEVALGKLQAAPFHAEDRQTVELALMGVFVEMDGEIARPDHDPWINIYKVQDLLFRFWGQLGDRVNAGYMFTLNQDLWPKQGELNQHVLGAAAPTLPGLQRRPIKGSSKRISGVTTMVLSCSRFQTYRHLCNYVAVSTLSSCMAHLTGAHRTGGTQ